MTPVDVLLTHPAGDDGLPVAQLEEHGFQVTTATSATNALATLSQGTFDCLVSLYRLPGDDGLDLFNAVRTIDEDTPFVLYADVDDSLANEAFSAGVDRYVSRDNPEAITRLVEEITELTSPVGDLPPQQDVSDREPDATEIVRAIDEAPIGISLCDPSLPDYPLVYVNDAWEDMTGYPRDEVLGRNPRILQGPATDEEARESVAAAIENETQITIELRNYRRDGTPFWNELTLSPIYDDDGELLVYVGFQNDVTGRRNTEELAEERAAKLTKEKRVLRRILGRVNGLLNDITHILVEENRRQLIAQGICDEVAAAEGYAACWFGSLNTAGTELELEAQSGFVDPIESGIRREALPGSLVEAVETDEIRLCTVNGTDGNALCPSSVDSRRLLVVPVTYGPKQYGLLGIYGQGSEALDRREQQLFESIGTMIASRLNAIETTQIITADTLIELTIAVRDESFPPSAIARTLGAGVEYVGMTSDSEAGTYELFLTTEPTDDTESVTTLPYVEDVREISMTDSTHTFAVTVSNGSPFTDLAEHGASVSSMSAQADSASLVIELPPEQDVRSTLGVLETQYDGVELRSRQERDARDQTMNEFASAVDEQLTARQRAAVEAAHMNGYFEWPRPTDGAEIADTMGITRQTFHQHLRAAERKLIDAYIRRYSDTASGAVVRQHSD